LAIVAIFLLLAAYFQSLKVALIVIGTIPAVIAGVAISLLLTGSTLNVQSFMGAIMAIGVAVANAILLATFAEQYRLDGAAADAAAIQGATKRTAVVRTSERQFVVRVRNGVAEWVDVRRGELNGDVIEVFGDLREGDIVVRRGNDEIRPGTKIAAAAAKG
jgi:hypothetical protein